MMRRYKVGITMVVVGVIAFLLAPHGPLGARVWPEPAMAIEPVGMQIPLVLGLSVLWSLTLGLGVAFLLFGWPYTKRVFAGAPRLAALAHVSVAWLLGNWWFHDNLHIVLGTENFWYVLAVEYGFHVTLMIAGALLAGSIYKASGPARVSDTTTIESTGPEVLGD